MAINPVVEYLNRPRCQEHELNEDDEICTVDADVQVTYPNGAEGDKWYYLCEDHFIVNFRLDARVPSEGVPHGWIQQVKYLWAHR